MRIANASRDDSCGTKLQSWSLSRHYRANSVAATRLGRIIRDVRRKITGRPEIEAALECRSRAPTRSTRNSTPARVEALFLPRSRGRVHRGKGKANAPYEFGVKASIVTTNARALAGNSCCTPKRSRATPTTATRSGPSSMRPRSSPAA